MFELFCVDIGAPSAEWGRGPARGQKSCHSRRTGSESASYRRHDDPTSMATKPAAGQSDKPCTSANLLVVQKGHTALVDEDRSLA
jgi:hypothetical protein